MQLSTTETATVLAALRCYQEELSSPPYPDAGDNVIATNNFEFDALTIDDIDNLCKRLNFEDTTDGKGLT